MKFFKTIDKRKCILIISWLLAAAAAGLIFYMSACDAEKSSSQSGKVTEVIEEIIYDDETPPDNFEGIVREIAHGAEFALFGFLLLNACRQSGFKKRYILTIVIAVLYAVTDELHQLSSPGRTLELQDICFDAIGAATGAALCELIIFIICKVKRKKCE